MRLTQKLVHVRTEVCPLAVEEALAGVMMKVCDDEKESVW
jgi:hypothetical protein